jgi:ketosteroid isomerase-like protein
VPDSATPHQVVEQLLHGIVARAWTSLPDLYAEDAVVEQPFALPRPTVLVGRPHIRAHFAAAAAAPITLEVRNLVVHQTTDPEVVVAEFDYHARVSTGGGPFTIANIQVLRVHDGQIVASRDYHNHAALAEAIKAGSGGG